MSDACCNADRDDASDLPIACSLTPAELTARRDELLPGLLARASGKEAVASGMRWRFDFEPGILTDIATVIAAEHRCCPFLRFELVVAPGPGSVCLEVTGPEGTADFLAALLDDA